jgi:hypothetical protein
MNSSAEENRSLLKTASGSQQLIGVPRLHPVDPCRHPRPIVAPLDWRLRNLLFNGGFPEHLTRDMWEFRINTPSIQIVTKRCPESLTIRVLKFLNGAS